MCSIYYKRAVGVVEGLQYYYGDLKKDCVGYLLRWYPDADVTMLQCVVENALADTWNGGCEVEEI